MHVEVLIEHLEHDGRRLAPGDVIDLERPEVLIELGAVRPRPEPAKPAKPAKEPKT